MYAEYFRLSENPFSITPDPHYLYLSSAHQEALAHLLYGIEGGGFVMLTGEVGTGKTTVCRAFLEQLPAHAEVALITNPALDAFELIEAICEEFHITLPAERLSMRAVTARLSEHLLRAHGEGRRAIVVIDEAQNLSADVIEQIRLLTNLETHKNKLLQIFLIGQPELRSMLARENLRQVAQRITARYHLRPLDRRGTAAYIQHRLAVAGAVRDLFEPGALAAVFKETRGVPRLINVLCDRALLGTYARNQSRVSKRTVRRAARELAGAERSRSRRPAPWVLVLGSTTLVAAAAVTVLRLPVDNPAGPRQAAVPPESVASPAPDAGLNTGPLAAASAPRPAPLAPGAGEPEKDALREPADFRVDAVTAEQRLASMWGLTYMAEAGEGFCEFCEHRGLSCVRETGNWETLRRFNRPAILRLGGASGESRFAVVAELSTNTVSVDIGGNLAVVPMGLVDSAWDGSFTLLWHRPPEVTAPLKVGASGPAVLWLRERLAQLQGQSAGRADNAYFDDELGSRVRQFQQSRGLREDGIVGERTLAQLQAGLETAGIPSLVAED